MRCIYVKRQSTNCRDAFEKLCLEFKKKIENKGTRFEYFNLIEGSITLEIDKKKIRRVFQNIVENSFKYTGENCKTTFKAVSEGDSVNIEVFDNGKGVPEEQINKIFDRFYRVDSSRCRESGGTGLGLAICKDIIENHGSKIIAKNLPKGGFVLIIKFNLENENHVI